MLPVVLSCLTLRFSGTPTKAAEAPKASAALLELRNSPPKMPIGAATKAKAKVELFRESSDSPLVTASLGTQTIRRESPAYKQRNQCSCQQCEC